MTYSRLEIIEALRAGALALDYRADVYRTEDTAYGTEMATVLENQAEMLLTEADSISANILGVPNPGHSIKVPTDTTNKGA